MHSVLNGTTLAYTSAGRTHEACNLGALVARERDRLCGALDHRIAQDIGYDVFVSATTIALVSVVATSLLGQRAGVLPKGLAWLGFVVAATTLVAFFFVPFLIFLGWTIVVSALLRWRERAVVPTSIEP